MVSFLQDLFECGTIHFRHAPEALEKTRQLEQLISRYFEADILELAGPELRLNITAALSAAEYLQRAAWFVVSRQDRAEVVSQCLCDPVPPKSAEDVASVDLFFRYLPSLYQRAVASSPDDILTESLKRQLLSWPLAGASADLSDPPSGRLDFFGHRGLQLRYAERLARRPRQGWKPTDPASLDVLTAVFLQQGLDLATLRSIPLTSPEKHPDVT
jgi:hypothetical protein